MLNKKKICRYETCTNSFRSNPKLNEFIHLSLYIRKNSHNPLNICLILCKVLISLFVKHIIFPSIQCVHRPSSCSSQRCCLPCEYVEPKALRNETFFSFVLPGIFSLPVFFSPPLLEPLLDSLTCWQSKPTFSP